VQAPRDQSLASRSKKRFAKYGLTLHPEKIHLLCFRKPSSKVEDAEKPETFNFLGFTHLWAKSRKGYWVIKRKTAKDRFARSLKRLSAWMRKVRYRPIAEQHKTLCSKVRGHLQYYGIRGNGDALSRFVYCTNQLWRKWLSRRSYASKRSWEWFNKLLERFPLPRPVVTHSC